MGLFGGKKDKSESLDTTDIKMAATGGDKNNINLNNMTPPTSAVNMNQNNNFVNPFANQNNSNNNQNDLQNVSVSNTNPLATSNNNFDTPINPIQNQQEITMQQTPIVQEQPKLVQTEVVSNDSKTVVDFEKIQEMIDETVEKIIDDKWEKLLMSIEKVVNWKEKAETEVNDLKSGISEIQEGFVNLEKKLSNKISSYDSGLLDVNSEIKALEKVFQKITPTLINNVNELSAIAKSIKESTGVKTPRTNDLNNSN